MSEWDTPPLRLCIFDTRRGQEEGHELDKILFFFPAECPLPVQLSVIGLSEGLITFTTIFSPEVPCELIESERQSHILYQPESDIWMVMVVNKGKEDDEVTRDTALQVVLKEAYCLFQMFYGSIRELLQQNPDGGVARTCLYAFLPDYLADFMGAKKLRLSLIQESLAERGTIQMFSLERETALEVQSLVNLLEFWFGGGKIRHTLIIFRDLLVSTTMPPEDTANLFAYARMRLTPVLHPRTPSKKGYLGIWDTPLNAVTSSLMGNNNSDAPKLPSRETSTEGQHAKCFVPKPLQDGRWCQDQDGFLVTDAWGADQNGRNAVVPTVWIQQSKEQMHLCVYRLKMLTTIMLLPIKPSDSYPEGSLLLRNEIRKKATPKIAELEKRLSKEWGGSNMYHVPGYRYLHVDHKSKVSRASPQSKVGTLSKDSLVALNRLRAEFDVAKSRAGRKGSDVFPDYEACVRTNNNAWVVVRIQEGHELYMVLERASDALLLTSEAVEIFNKRYCNGIFLSD